MLDIQPTADIPALPGQIESKNVFRLGEIFAGAGGMALGAHAAKFNGNRFTHVWINDIDRDACDTFVHNMPLDEANVHCCDAAKLKFKKLPSIDGLVFGFPCNDFSIVGDRHGIDGHFGGLYTFGVKALREQKPLFFVAENVSGLSSSGDALEIIEQALEDSGYNISKQTYKFEQYGVPQSRHRIIIVGFRKDLGISEFKHPRPTTAKKPISCAEALKGAKSCPYNNELTNHSPIVLERLKYIKPGQNIFTADMPEHLQLQMTSNATISQIYRRLIPNKPSYTITGSGGGGTHVYHWKENRALTNRERARLQSFPDDFEFLGGKESVRRQIGMAVPPAGVKTVFKAVMKTLVENGVDSQC